MNKRLIFRLLGYAFCVLPPLYAILEHFPLFAREGGRPMLSGVALLLLLVTVIPLRRGILKALRRWLASPSAIGIWGAVWLISAWLASIAATVSEIALVGVLSSLVGTLFFRLGRREVAREP